MDWDNDFDVKEYHPKKKSDVTGANLTAANIPGAAFAAANFCNPLYSEPEALLRAAMYSKGMK